MALKSPSTQPSVSLRITFPTKPSQITTSHLFLKISLPSILPTKLILVSDLIIRDNHQMHNLSAEDHFGLPDIRHQEIDLSMRV